MQPLILPALCSTLFPMHRPDASDEPVEPIIPPEADPAVKVPLALEDWLAVILLAALAIITFLNVLVRYLTDQSFAWTEEISVFLLIVLTMVGASMAFVRNHHIRIEILADNGSPRRQYLMALTAHGLVVFFFALLTVLSARLVYDEFRYEETSPAIGVPTWWYSVWMPLLAAVITLRVAGAARRLTARRKAEP
ncbi:MULTISPECIES: TRAP transporter small permease [Bordetella]|uniref:TRAP transporter small permease n=1 Tax=Bordetella TaxID=517 RepID=UPI0009B88D2C|nr:MULTISPECIES: TRAP transporter small permease [Bordetella]ARP77013.1 TRAP transporter permease DctQ [Bordetella genomosp. 6]AZW44600.1 TRAP transporter small permease [Bordetella bronchiseptica]